MDTPPASRATVARVLAAIAALFTVLTLTVVVTDEDKDGKPDKVVIELRGQDEQPAGVPAGPETLTLEGAGVDVYERAKDTDLGGHDGLVNERPVGADDADLEAAVEQQGQLAESDRLPDVTPLAAPRQRGCETRLVGNYSSRNGVRPRLFVLHYTVSRNRPGRADVDGITAYFNNPGSQASSHYVVDADGNCSLIVRETSKAWTQAAANPVAIAVEVIAYGDEADYAAPAGYRKLGRIFADAGKRWEIPLQRGQVDGCRVIRPGIVDHRAFGSCGGGHHDVSPFEPRDRAIARVLEEAKRVGASTSTAPAPRAVVVWCRRLEWYRARVRGDHPTTPDMRRNARARKDLVARRGYACGRSGPVKAG